MVREPVGTATAETVVRRSRFLAMAEPVTSREEATHSIRRRRDDYPDATHVVYAFLLGPPESETPGMSDAGEPKGTAGRPVLAVLRGSGVTDCLLTVVRYYGGTKLGTGGLMRAYSSVAKKALGKLETRPRVRRVRFSLTSPYSLHERITVILTEHDAIIVGQTFGSLVTIDGELPEAECTVTEAMIGECSAGTVAVTYKS
jgi:uncharacterized YigZ family protein